MLFAIDLRPISPGVSGGIVPALRGVLGRMFRMFPDDRFHVFTTIFNRGLLEERENVHFHTLPTRTFYARMDRVIQTEGVEALFRAYPVSDDSTFPLARQVVLVPDVQHEQRPEFFDPGVLRCRRAAFNRFLSQAGAIGTNTGHSREQILALPVTRCRDVFLMPPALTEQHVPVTASDLTDAERALVPREPFFYYPANLWAHKNHGRLLEAFARVREQSGLPLRMVLTGHPEGFETLRAQFPGLPVEHLGFVRPQLVRMLLQKAVALTFFSQYEGFGIPLLEAFSARCAVVCSNTTSLPEVAGDAAIQVDPDDVQAMADAMRQVATDPALRRTLVEKGTRRLGVWTWDKSAANLRAALGRVVKHPPDDKTPAPDDPAPGGVIQRIGGLYHAYWHEKGFTIPRAWREVQRRARPMLFGSPTLNGVALRWAAAGRVLDRVNPVRGLRADNTLAPASRIVLRQELAQRELRLCGVASGEGTLEVWSEQTRLAEAALAPGRRVCVTFMLPRGASRTITVRVRGGARFQVDETNLFTEQDVY